MKQKEFYMVYVDGMEMPKVKHFSYEIALSEAKRLAELMKKPTFVLRTTAVVKLPDRFIVEEFDMLDISTTMKHSYNTNNTPF
jgi:hypothetical protein